MNPFPRKQFMALLASILNMPTAYVTWQGQKDDSPLFPGKQFLWASMNVGTRARHWVGGDDLRRTDGPGGTITTLQVGRRVMSLSLNLYTYASIDDVIADDQLELLRTRLWQPVNLDVVNAMGLVIETAGPVVPLPTFINSRYISAANLDMTAALALTDQAFYPGPNNSVGEVIGTGTVTTEGGGTTPVPYDVKESVHP